MDNEHQFQFSLGVIAYPLFLVLALWMVLWADFRFGLRLSQYGIYPQTLVGLRGIVFSPFIHSGMQHLAHNSIPLLVLLTALLYDPRPIAWRVIVCGILLLGFLTWCIGRPSYHIGASGLVYVLVSFIFFKGVFIKYYRLVALSLTIVFLYGSMVWYALPIEDGISWEGHLSGLITGFLFALLFKKAITKPKKYDWEKPDYNEDDDAFLKHFDENGNFIEEAPSNFPAGKEQQSENKTDVTVNYIYKENFTKPQG
ncbi:MAG: rhomboid family intramembrane serine protease [Flavobacteriaceae bacterium]